MFIIHNGSNQPHKTCIIIISHHPFPSPLSTNAIDGLQKGERGGGGGGGGRGGDTTFGMTFN